MTFRNQVLPGILCGIVLSCGSLCLAAEKYALFVGVSKYQHADMNKPQLEFPEVDATALATLFKDAGYAVDVLLGKQATRQAIREKISRLNRKGDADGVVAIGLFGHGVEFESTKVACYCPYDATLRNVMDSKGRQVLDDDGKPMTEPDPDSLITMPELLAGLRVTPAGNRILLADCCRTSPNKARGRAFGANVVLTDLPENTAAFFACSANEQAFEHPDWGHGAFTRCLLDEIKSQAGKGRVTSGMLADRLRPAVSQLVSKSAGGKRQTTRSLVTDVVDFQLAVARPKDQPPASSNTKKPVSLPRLVAPFDGKTARSAQEAWAKSRGINVVTRNSIDAEMVLIPPGEFLMGNEDSIDDLAKLFPYVNRDWVDDARPQHKVRITKPFLVAKYEVTIRQFRQFVDATGHLTDAEKDGKGGRRFDTNSLDSVQDRRINWRGKAFDPAPTDTHPVINVSWNDAVAFCNWLSGKEGKSPYYQILGGSVTIQGGDGYRLLSEAEWEYACRAGTMTRFPNGTDAEGLTSIANVWDGTAEKKFNKGVGLNSKDGFVFTSPVGTFAPNNFGLCDMIGNVWEWTGDWHGGYYSPNAVDDPTGASTGSVRVFRGACWDFFAVYCRSAMRASNTPDYRFSHLGFRIAAGN